MIGLIAAGRDGGGDGSPVFFTVPWSPSVEARGQMPGAVYTRLRSLLDELQKSGLSREFGWMSESSLFMRVAGMPEYGLAGAVGVCLARRLMLELGLLVRPGVDGSGPQP